MVKSHLLKFVNLKIIRIKDQACGPCPDAFIHSQGQRFVLHGEPILPSGPDIFVDWRADSSCSLVKTFNLSASEFRFPAQAEAQLFLDPFSSTLADSARFRSSGSVPNQLPR
jgi:hypothetical protein